MGDINLRTVRTRVYLTAATVGVLLGCASGETDRDPAEHTAAPPGFPGALPGMRAGDEGAEPPEPEPEAPNAGPISSTVPPLPVENAECAPLQGPATPEVEACGGEPFGTWRLTTFTLNVAEFVVSRDGAPTQTCPAATTQNDAAVPNVLMELIDGGSARYYSERVVMTQAWSESCVIGAAPELGCEDPTVQRDNFWDCQLACDACSCSTALVAEEEEGGSWLRTAEQLTLGLWGEPTDYDYCVTSDTLGLSVPGVFMEFERVHIVSSPTPCAERDPSTCTAGLGCRMGLCTGAEDCQDQTTEGECLTVMGCSWDTSRCSGSTQDACTLGDYGEVPGCDFVPYLEECGGTALACRDRDEATCTQGGGCRLTQRASCAGGTVSCTGFPDCPDDLCSVVGANCIGTIFCSDFDTEDECWGINVQYGDVACSWMTWACEGAPTPCTEVPQEECAAASGCQLLRVD